MKRVLLFRFLVFSTIAILVFLICKYGFYREAKVSFPDKTVEIKQTQDNTPYLLIGNGKWGYVINITNDQSKCYTKNKYYIGKWYEMHLILHFFFWAFMITLIIYYIWSVISVWSCLYDKNQDSFLKYRYCDGLCVSRCKLYNSINEYDLTPVKKKFNQFWGY